MHEVYANALKTIHLQGHPVAGMPEEDQLALDAVISHLNERYTETPGYKTAQEWALERQILLISFIAYLWYYQNDPIEFLASEVPFELPLLDPKVKLPLPTSEVLRVGKIDHIIKWHGGVCALERKSTSRGIAADSDYWDKAKKDTQVSMYALAFRDMCHHRNEDNSPGVWWLGETRLEQDLTQTRFGNTLYDVWHKPTIKPCELTQAETAEFITTGQYEGQKFEVYQMSADPLGYAVNGSLVEVKPGKKGFAIRESVEMFGARLLQDIYARPDFYFVRREIARTDAEIDGFKKQLFAVYQSQKSADRSGCWVENESACRATYACAYIPICYGAGADSVCDGKTTPPGFRRIFVDLTVNGVEVDE